MKIIDPYYVIETPIHGEHRDRILRLIELSARTCYKSEGKATTGSAPEFVRKMTQVRKHESVIEHASATVRFVVDRGVSHELVRHRLAAFSQESTRYCNYCSEKFGREITVIKPPFWSECDHRFHFWKTACEAAENQYLALLDYDATPQEARSVLPNSLKTEVVMTCNMREWRHVFRMRTSEAAHPQMRQVMVPLLAEFKQHLPELFGDL
jgi:thymidylate synthase (FAD)